jgi:DNA N-6-adenine-methyltransferase (Dam)
MTDQLFASPTRSTETDERFTPAWIFDGLALTCDLDPAAPVDGGDHVPARHRYTRHDDGLARDWFGLVWLNPPFSEATRWADRFRTHGRGVFLGPVANSRWWYDAARTADLVWHCRDFPFDSPGHRGRWSSMPLAFLAYGDDAAAGVDRLARSGRHPGVLMVVAP